MAKKKQEEVEDKSTKIKNLIIIIFTMIVIFSLFSHNKSDLDILDGGRIGIVQNWFGFIGAYFSKYMFLCFGVAAYVVGIILAVCTLRIFIPIPMQRKDFFTVLALLIFGITLIFAMHPESYIKQAVELGIGDIKNPLSSLSGGIPAQILVAPENGDIPAGFIRRWFGDIGAFLCSLVIALTGAFYLWKADWIMVYSALIAKYQERQKNKFSDGNKKKISKSKDGDEEEIDSEEEQDDSKDPQVIADKLRNKVSSNSPEEDKEMLKDENEDIDENTNNDKKDILAPEINRYDENKDEPALDTKPQKRTYSTAPVELPDFKKPPVKLLDEVILEAGDDDDIIEETSMRLQKTLNDFRVAGEVNNVIIGPRISRYEIVLEPGINVKKVTQIESNIAMELAAETTRILAPIPGKNAVGIEVPNKKSTPVIFRHLLESTQWTNSKADIPIVLGKNVAGKPIILDLAKAPHLLIAGATGSGKSVCMNTLIMSLLFKFSPEDLRLIMVDPKVVEMEMYTPLPHLITPVVNEATKIPLALRWGVNEMEKRYKTLAKVKVKNLNGYNQRAIPDEPVLDGDGNEIPKKLPYVIIIIDELADVMMTDAKSEVEMSIARIAQKGRAAGIHIVIATQRPSTNIITGVIKANLPTRIAFQVGSGTDSRVILDSMGAEKLLGAGDMLFIPPGSSNNERIQGAWINDNEIEKVVDFVSAQAPQDFDISVVADDSEGGDDIPGDVSNGQDEGYDVETDNELNKMLQKYLKPGDSENFKNSLEIVLRDRKVSTSYIQRCLKIGYNKAAEIVDEFEARGIVSAPLPGGSKREILITDSIENE